MEKVLIAGGSGLIGQQLAKHLQNKGYAVRILGRSKDAKPTYPTYIWNIASNYIETDALQQVDYIINLAGENIGSKAWTKKRKKEILTSRTKSTKLLFKTILQNKIPLKAYITASAVGYYGAITSEKIFTEKDKHADDFLGNVCEKWETASHVIENLNIRTVQIRTGVVLTQKGGALEKMMTPIKKGFGAVLGNGNQFVPWIHIDDLCGIYEFALQNSKIEGAYNGVAPEYIEHKYFTYSLAKKLKKKIWLPAIPAFMLKLLLGEMADLVLYGSRISSEKLAKTGFQFNYPSLEKAFKAIFK